MSIVPETVAWLKSKLAPNARLIDDSRAVQGGDAFVAFPGERNDGRKFIGMAIERGAGAVLAERDGLDWQSEWLVPHRAVDELRALCGPIGDAYYGAPTAKLGVIAVTGTSGKTSCSNWIAQLFGLIGEPCGVVGTLGARLIAAPDGAPPFEPIATSLTTPDALQLQALFAQLRRAGARQVTIEASSIGIEMGRLEASRIRTAVFTNLTREHLDFHRDMDGYGRAKAKLFAWPGLAHAVVNADDPASDRMLDAVRPGVIKVAYSIDVADPTAVERLAVDHRIRATRIDAGAQSTRVTIDAGEWGKGEVELPMLGRFNVANALASAGVVLLEGHRLPAVLQALGRLLPVEGRMQWLNEPGAPLVVVDYAHKPDALQQVLLALSSTARARGGRLWCVFGCGGDRDAGKRPQMGEIASRLADCVVLTSDNPRGEEPGTIIDQIAAGCVVAPVAVEADRRAAIELALAGAEPADLVLIAGKGHEAYQEIRGVRTPFSDIAIARAALVRRR